MKNGNGINWNASSTCKLCGNKYMCVQDARRHARQKHPDVDCVNTAISSTYEHCKYSGCSFKTIWYSHMATHMKRYHFPQVIAFYVILNILSMWQIFLRFSRNKCKKESTFLWTLITVDLVARTRVVLNVQN